MPKKNHVKMKEEIGKTISNNMKRALEDFRKRRGVLKSRCECCGQLIPDQYTQEWVGQQAGMTKATVVHYFQGKRVPSVVSLHTIAEVLEVSVEDLLKKENKND
mgnify:CR=1 FL=1